ncbi:MAG: NAD-dependent epimerase/dehydratase family protein [Chloroflexota bacterium]
MNTKKTMITGGAGFIGSHIARRMVEAGHQVLNYDLVNPTHEAAWWLKPVIREIQFASGSVEDQAKVTAVVKNFRPEIIIHLAAVVNPVLLKKEPGLAFRINLGGTLNILEAARQFGVERVVNSSSQSVLSPIQYEPVDADHPLMTAKDGPGASFYSATKIGGEAFCWAYHQSYELDFITIRASAVYGIGQQWPIYIKPFVENSINGIPTHYETGGDYPRDYTHVEDVAQIYHKAACLEAENVKDRIFYAASGQPLVTASQVASTVKSLIPNADIEIGPGLSAEDQHALRYRGVLSIENAIQQLGYKPKYANIKDGLVEYIDQYRRYLTDSGQTESR